MSPPRLWDKWGQRRGCEVRGEVASGGLRWSQVVSGDLWWPQVGSGADIDKLRILGS